MFNSVQRDGAIKPLVSIDSYGSSNNRSSSQKGGFLGTSTNEAEDAGTLTRSSLRQRYDPDAATTHPDSGTSKLYR